MNIKLYNLLLLILILSLAEKGYSQSTPPPDGIIFQAVATDPEGNPAANRIIDVKSSIIQTSATGSVVYSESFQVTASAIGVFTIVIGKGNRLSGPNSISSLDWSEGPYFLNLKVAIEPSVPEAGWIAANQYVDMGTSQFWSVPFALYAGNVAGMSLKLNIADTTGMLANYKSSIAALIDDTVYQAAQLGSKVRYNDTANILSGYVRKGLTVQYSDTANMLSHYVRSSGLAFVAKTGSYTDLLNTPAIGNIASLNTIDLTSNISNTLPILNGGTGSTTASSALANLGGISLNSLSASTPLSYNYSSGSFSISQATNSSNGYLSSTDWNSFNNKQNSITLTTTGNSGNATFVSNSLNIPNYTYTLPPATASSLGGVIIGSNIGNSNGTISLSSSNIISALGFTPYNTTNPNNYIPLTALSATTAAPSGTGSLAYNNSSGTFTFTPPSLNSYLTSAVTTFSGGSTGLTPLSAINGAVSLAGTLNIANGGTGQTTAQAAINGLVGSGYNSAGYYLRSNGTNVVMSQISTSDIPTLNQNTTGSAGSVSNSLTFNNSGSGASSGATFNGSSAQTISYNTFGASPLNSPSFTGTPTAPTAAVGTNTTQLATTAFVTSAVSTSSGVTSFSAGSTGLTPSSTSNGAVTLAGTLTVANGGTGLNNINANSVILGNGSSALQTVAPSTNGNVLTSNGTTWVSLAPLLIREVADESTASNSQTSFTLSQSPSSNSKVRMFINGVRISNTAYSVTGTSLTYNPNNNGGYILNFGDRIQFDYYY